MEYDILVSFVHGYNNLDINLPDVERPALWQISQETSKYYSYPFPRNPSDFTCMKELICGTMPLKNAENFKKLPRFGFTGIQACGDSIYAGSWNGVYRIRRDSFKLKNIISNNLMNDMHGIYIDDNILITVLTSKDTVVITDHEGVVMDYFSIMKDLNVVRDKKIEEIDWRFISKQFRGSTGYWHFNFVQKFKDELWLTSRNASAFVVVDLKTLKAHLRLMNLCTPAMLHDGKLYDGSYYFTSVDGKIIISQDSRSSHLVTQERVENMHLYNRDLVSKVIRLNETALAREPNWCRGIDARNGIIFVAIDGRYDTDLSFGLLALREDNQEILSNHRLRWSEIGNEKDLRFVTGFDVLVPE